MGTYNDTSILGIPGLVRCSLLAQLKTLLVSSSHQQWQRPPFSMLNSSATFDKSMYSLTSLHPPHPLLACPSTNMEVVYPSIMNLRHRTGIYPYLYPPSSRPHCQHPTFPHFQYPQEQLHGQNPSRSYTATPLPSTKIMVIMSPGLLQNSTPSSQHSTASTVAQRCFLEGKSGHGKTYPATTGLR